MWLSSQCMRSHSTRFCVSGNLRLRCAACCVSKLLCKTNKQSLKRTKAKPKKTRYSQISSVMPLGRKIRASSAGAQLETHNKPRYSAFCFSFIYILTWLPVPIFKHFICLAPL